MSFTYYLPKENGEPELQTTENNSVIIIGANGSGKSRLGAWIELHSSEQTHRISAQRSLELPDSITPRNYEQSISLVQYGYEDTAFIKSNPDPIITKKSSLYHNGRYTTTERRDFDPVIAAVFAKRNKQFEDYDKKQRLNGENLPRETNIIDDFLVIWNTVFPQRRIDFRDGQIIAAINGEEYNAAHMSDGERVALYLIAQALCIPENKTIIIDEPEIHLHRSIMNKLWETIESKRPDCLFIYITHDTQFAANNKSACKIWVKNFNGTKWELEKVNGSYLPEQLLLGVLGNRKPVLFVEGTDINGSASHIHDTELYSIIYKDYYVVSCGSCEEVIRNTKAMKSSPQLHHLEVYGIVDKDFRTPAEINKLKSSDVYVLKVAEFENLFLVEELMRVVAEHLQKDDAVAKTKEFIVDTKFNGIKAQQINKATAAEVSFQLRITPTETKELFERSIRKIKYDVIHSQKEELFNDTNLDYAGVLAIFNEKGLAKTVGKFFGLCNDGYCDLVLRLAKGEKSVKIVEALTGYLPSEIPLS